MKKSTSIIFIALFAVLAGCENATAINAARIANRDAEAKGSPFRWEVKSAYGGTAMTRVMIDLPRGSSKADQTLKKDILAQIEKVELSKQRGTPEIDEVRLMSDGREVWILKNREGIAYVVSLRLSPQGGTDFSIDGPTAFQRRCSLN